MFCLREDTLSDQGIFDLKRVLEKRYILKKNHSESEQKPIFWGKHASKKTDFESRRN